MRLLIVQYGGDYSEAFKNLSSGGEETYGCQKYTVNVVMEITKKPNIEEVTTLCFLTEQYYDELLGTKLRAIGMGYNQKTISDKSFSVNLIKILENYKPTHLILRTPNQQILKWCIANKVKTMATFADSFEVNDIRSYFRNWKLKNLLNNPQIEWVTNHQTPASKSLANIGVKKEKIIPWDWHPEDNSMRFKPKFLAQKTTYELIYVGMIIPSKGVGDILNAIATLKLRNFSVKLTLVGKGNIEEFVKISQKLDIEDLVKFLGLISNSQVINFMANGDIIIIPSRHEYSEGFPNTVNEALFCYTPIIASDHPVFVEKLKHKQNALIFPAGNFRALADSIEMLLSNKDLYQLISSNSYDTWKSLQIPVKWGDLIHRWLSDSSEDRNWLLRYNLISGNY
ncbi:glycosyltransferase [Geminocystis sp. GBBB08]|uniref:glycosyltransferase family 4 protein n=1 Tax=Geminocystis sp. GBBB08 TaxID=2604140 RepID=UPI0027E33475|nr:glycosyltransferase [Geminocystis sp. GBBB08]MBL1211611.1 glycosyltransferase [Geminocystis sp. GBBB08]